MVALAHIRLLIIKKHKLFQNVITINKKNLGHHPGYTYYDNVLCEDVKCASVIKIIDIGYNATSILFYTYSAAENHINKMHFGHG